MEEYLTNRTKKGLVISYLLKGRQNSFKYLK